MQLQKQAKHSELSACSIKQLQKQILKIAYQANTFQSIRADHLSKQQQQLTQQLILLQQILSKQSSQYSRQLEQLNDLLLKQVSSTQSQLAQFRYESKQIQKLELLQAFYDKTHARIQQVSRDRKLNKDKLLHLLETIITRLRNCHV